MGEICWNGGNIISFIRGLITQVFSVDHGSFKGALRKWFPKHLDDLACTNLVFRLDEYNIGSVNVTTLDEFAGTKSLQIKIAEYMFKQGLTNDEMSGASTIISRTPTTSPRKDATDGMTSMPISGSADELQISISTSSLSISTLEIRTPLLIWVDDNPSHNILHVNKAKELGITVLEFLGTAEAKVWIDENLGNSSRKHFNEEDFLLAHNSGDKIRFITDNVRFEAGDSGPFLNPRAGDDILRYIRGRRLTEIPLLVFCGYSLPMTKYVEQFNLAGSCNKPHLVQSYIEGLQEGVDDSSRWAKFNAR